MTKLPDLPVRVRIVQKISNILDVKRGTGSLKRATKIIAIIYMNKEGGTKHNH